MFDFTNSASDASSRRRSSNWVALTKDSFNPPMIALSTVAPTGMAPELAGSLLRTAAEATRVSLTASPAGASGAAARELDPEATVPSGTVTSGGVTPAAADSVTIRDGSAVGSTSMSAAKIPNNQKRNTTATNVSTKKNTEELSPTA